MGAYNEQENIPLQEYYFTLSNQYWNKTFMILLPTRAYDLSDGSWSSVSGNLSLLLGMVSI